MKKITLILLASFTILSCSDDDNDTESVNGTWKLTSVTLNPDSEWDYNHDGILSANFLDEAVCLQDATIEFGANNTAVFKIANLGTGTAKVSSDAETPPCAQKTPDNTTFAVNGNTVTFTYYSIEVPGIEITSTYTLSGNKLTVTFDNDSNYYIPGDGENGDTDNPFQGGTFVYTKQ